MKHPMKPRIAIIPGDPSGIGPELIAKLLQEADVKEAANILLVGDAHVWKQGAKQARKDVVLNTIPRSEISSFEGVAHLNLQTCEPEEIEVANICLASGRSSLRNLESALDLAKRGLIDGILFAPFNKAALTLAGMEEQDEHQFIAKYIGFSGHHSEINVLDDIMTTRVTSHISLGEVARNINELSISRAIDLAAVTLKRFGIEYPHIAVAALNPHAGDNGKFGREEIDVIGPVIQNYQQSQMKVTGPWPSDTVFLKAQNREVDAVVTMYHDQGQIAMKLMGFERGVTVAGGLPIPIVTPAHGTAFDIAGKGVASASATLQAFRLLLRTRDVNAVI